MSRPTHTGMRDYYAVLGVQPGATQDQIERAFREKAARLQADLYGDAPEQVQEGAAQELRLSERAFEVLSDRDLRQLYNERFQRQSTAYTGLPDTKDGSEAAIPEFQAVLAPAAAGPMEVGQVPWGPRDALIGVLVAAGTFVLIVALIAGSVMAVTGETEGTAITVAGLVATMLFDAALFGTAYALAVRKYNLTLSALGFNPVRVGRWWIPVVAAFATLAAVVAYNATMTAIGADALAPEQEVDDLIETRALLPLVGVLIVIVAPLTEEVFFRGFLFPALVKRFRVWGAALLTGALFGAAHITGMDTIGLIIPLGAVGVFFAWLYYRTGSLWIAIGTHFLVNLVGFASLVGTS